MTRLTRLIPLLMGMWLLTACGVKSDPEPPKPKPTKSSATKTLPQVSTSSFLSRLATEI